MPKRGIDKRYWVIGIIILILVFCGIYYFKGFTGYVVNSGMGGGNAPPATIGPSESDISCMMSCMKCTSPGVGCTGDQATCQAQCNVKKPDNKGEGEGCMQECILKGCGEFDFSCQNGKKDECEKECKMIKEPEAKSEEEQCIRDCVNSHAPGTMCGASKEGETGNEICQMCAAQCVHLYSGPCLDDAGIREKQRECGTCEHCYGEPVMGDSGQGWECIVDVKCGDASSEFGDNPGVGEGIAKAVGNVGEAIGNVFENVGDFFQGLFGGNTEEKASGSVESGGGNEESSSGGSAESGSAESSGGSEN